MLLAFVSASILHKLTYNRFFLKWLASHQLKCFLVPDAKQLRKLSDTHHNKKSPRHSHQKTEHHEDIKVPASNLVHLELETSVIKIRDLELLSYSHDLEWIIDLAIMSFLSFILVESQFHFYPQTSEYNFSLLWALLVVIYCIKTLWTITRIYFLNTNYHGERGICFASAAVFMILAIYMIFTKDNIIVLKLDETLTTFRESIMNDAETTQSHIARTKSYVVTFKFILVATCSLIGMMFTFPGLRFGQLHKALVEDPETSGLARLIYNINYFSTLLIVALWIKPMTEFVLDSFGSTTESEATLNTIRLHCISLAILLKLALIPKYVSSYLQSAGNRIKRLRCRGGTVSGREVQRTVAYIYNYLHIVNIQYILPSLICFFLVIIYKSLGGYSWFPPTLSKVLSMQQSHSNVTSPLVTNEIVDFSNAPEDGSANLKFLSAYLDLIDVQHIRNALSRDLFKGLTGFFVWWAHFAWFCTSTAGYVYHTYFIH